MIDGTWLWYDWTALFVLTIAVVFAGTLSHAVILQRGHRVWAALSLVAWLYFGSLAILVFILGGYYVQ